MCQWPDCRVLTYERSFVKSSVRHRAMFFRSMLGDRETHRHAIIIVWARKAHHRATSSCEFERHIGMLIWWWWCYHHLVSSRDTSACSHHLVSSRDSSPCSHHLVSSKNTSSCYIIHDSSSCHHHLVSSKDTSSCYSSSCILTDTIIVSSPTQPSHKMMIAWRCVFRAHKMMMAWRLWTSRVNRACVPVVWLVLKDLCSPKRGFCKVEQIFPSACSTHVSTILSPNQVLTPLKRASNTHSERFVRPYKILVWGA